MKVFRLTTFATALITWTLACTGAVPSPAQQAPATTAHPPIDMKLVKPELVGFSSERLENLHKVMQASVDQKQISGIVTILARHGKVVDYRTYGDRDMATNSPMTKDAIFRDYRSEERRVGKECRS